jgi:hypothetical protein
MGINNSLADARQSNGFYEYLLVAHPDTPVNEKISLEKNRFSVKYDEKIAAATRAHTTIANFIGVEAMEPTIARWTHQVVSSIQSFPVILDKFAGFPKHTIYIGVQDPIPFQQLAKKLKPVADYIRDSGCPSARLLSQPHFSIARGLSAMVYDKAMPYYTEKNFYASFMIEELVLLRRRHQFDKCQTVQVFRFRPPVSQPVSDVA